MSELNGIIISSLGDGYKVLSGDETIICKARGVFRNRNITPVCGDKVVIEKSALDEGLIVDVLDRKNEIIRPPLANLDQLVFVISTCEPYPNLLILDKFLAVAEYKGIEPVIVFTKTDKEPADKYVEIYADNFKTLCVDNTNLSGIDGVRKVLTGKFSAFTGNSGAGKSSLLNNLCPGLNLSTNEISRKLGRGKHTTRRVDIYPIEGGYVADTPGFSTFETQMYDVIMKEDLADCFPDFSDYIGKCKYINCSHTKEQGCAVIQALNNGEIKPTRHKSYCAMYEDALNIKPWEVKNSRR